MAAETFKVRWNNFTFHLSKSLSYSIKSRFILVDTHLWSLKIQLHHFLPLSVNIFLLHLAMGTINHPRLYWLFWHICSSSHWESTCIYTNGKRKTLLDALSGSISYEQCFYCITLSSWFCTSWTQLHLCPPVLCSLFLHDCFLSEMQD